MDGGLAAGLAGFGGASTTEKPSKLKFQLLFSAKGRLFTSKANTLLIEFFFHVDNGFDRFDRSSRRSVLLATLCNSLLASVREPRHAAVDSHDSELGIDVPDSLLLKPSMTACFCPSQGSDSERRVPWDGKIEEDVRRVPAEGC